MKTKWLIPSVLTLLLAMPILSTMAFGAFEKFAPNVTSQFFVTNYTVGSNTYIKGGTTIRINATVGNITNDTVANYSVTAIIYLGGAKDATVTLTNSSKNLNSSQTWSGTYAVPSTSYTGADSNITINATFRNVTGQWPENSSQIITIRVDATNPVTGDTNEATQIWKRSQGQSKTISASMTDNVAIATATINFTSVPPSSTVGNAQMTCGSGTTSRSCDYTLTPDFLGDYIYHFETQDNVTNSVSNSTNHTITVRQRHSAQPVLPETGSDMQQDNEDNERWNVEGRSQGILSSITKIPSHVVGAFMSIFKFFSNIF